MIGESRWPEDASSLRRIRHPLDGCIAGHITSAQLLGDVQFTSQLRLMPLEL